MKAAEWKRVVRPLLPTGESWNFRGSFCHRSSAEWVATGILGEGSGFDDGAYVWVVQMPLFVPTEVIDLSYSSRVGGGAQKYHSAEPEVLSRGISVAIKSVPTEHDALQRLAQKPDLRNRSTVEVAAYACIILDELARADQFLDLATRGRVEQVWEEEITTRATSLRALLSTNGRQECLARLQAWVGETAGALGLQLSRTYDN